MNTIEYKLPISELFNILGYSNIKYETAIVPSQKIQIQSTDGFVPINALVKKFSSIAKYVLSDGRSITCSTKHIVFEHGVARLISKCKFIDTVTGPISIDGIEYLNDGEVFDVALDAPHQYITPNGIIHHNSCLANVLINELDIEDYDVLEINASRTNGVEEVRNLIVNFVSMIPFGAFKVVLLEEADGLTINAQAALRGVMETYASSSRFILTCNYPHKIIPAIHSRCQGFHIEKTDQTEYTARVATILITENVEFDLDTLDTYVKLAYPDLRKCINMVQQNVTDNQLMSPMMGESSSNDYKVQMVELFKAGKIQAARKLICSRVRPEEIEELYTWMYQNSSLFGATEDQHDSAVLIIKQGLCDHTICADSELNLAACLIKLARLQ